MPSTPKSDLELGKLNASKLVAVVYNQHLGKTKSARDGFSDEILYFGFDDMGQWFNFHPLSEIINDDEQKLLLT